MQWQPVMRNPAKPCGIVLVVTGTVLLNLAEAGARGVCPRAGMARMILASTLAAPCVFEPRRRLMCRLRREEFP